MKNSKTLFLFVVLLVAGCLADNFSGNPANHPAPQKQQHTCPDCGEENCIYEEINAASEGATDSNIYDAVIEVCNRRNITDTATIQLILSNYYL